MIPIPFWWRPCDSGHCVEVQAGDDVGYVRDSKRGEDSPVLEFSDAQWTMLLGDLECGLPLFGAYTADDRVVLAHPTEPVALVFTADEWDAFEVKALAGECDVSRLREMATAGVG